MNSKMTGMNFIIFACALSTVGCGVRRIWMNMVTAEQDAAGC